VKSGRGHRGQDKAENRDAGDHDAQHRNDETAVPPGHFFGQPADVGPVLLPAGFHLLLRHGPCLSRAKSR